MWRCDEGCTKCGFSQQSSCATPQGGGGPDGLTGSRALAGCCFTRPHTAHLTAHLPGCLLPRPCCLSAHQSQGANRPLVQPPPSQIPYLWLSLTAATSSPRHVHTYTYSTAITHTAAACAPPAVINAPCSCRLTAVSHNPRQGQSLTLLLPAAPCAPWLPFGSAASPSPPAPAAC